MQIDFLNFIFMCLTDFFFFFFLQISLWQPHVKQVYGHHFSNSIWLLQLSKLYFVVFFFTIFQTFSLLLYLLCKAEGEYYFFVVGLWPVIFDITTVVTLGHQETSPYKTAHLIDQFISVTQLCPILQPYGLQHARLPSLSPAPRAHSDSCPSSLWGHPTISSSVIPFSYSLQSFPASGSFLISQFLSSGDRSIGVSVLTSVLPMNIQDWFP